VIDVGTTRVPDPSKKKGFHLNGDVKFDEVAPKCSFITPVPGGVGPMTICSSDEEHPGSCKKRILSLKLRQ
jgi:methylenetetrahydrofolate dehydrogenase (NADP+)/methenyltetrahydrofolate cyclohydrolase